MMFLQFCTEASVFEIYTRLCFFEEMCALKLGGIEISISVTVFLKYRGIPKYSQFTVYTQ